MSGRDSATRSLTHSLTHSPPSLIHVAQSDSQLSSARPACLTARRYLARRASVNIGELWIIVGVVSDYRSQYLRAVSQPTHSHCQPVPPGGSALATSAHTCPALPGTSLHLVEYGVHGEVEGQDEWVICMWLERDSHITTAHNLDTHTHY
jgi:hypothetical protein